MTPLLLDSCTWIWLASDKKRLSAAAWEAITSGRSANKVHLSVISCWEVAKLVEKGKLSFGIPLREWVDRALRLDGIQLEALTPRVCVDSTGLPGKFHGDPADQIIVATARAVGAAVVTPDKEIRGYAHVPTVW